MRWVCLFLLTLCIVGCGVLVIWSVLTEDLGDLVLSYYMFVVGIGVIVTGGIAFGFVLEVFREARRSHQIVY